MTAETKERITIPVSGMHCAACVSKVERALGEVSGVEGAQANLATDNATVAFAGSVTSAAQIKRTIRELGYQVSEKEAGASALDREREARQHEIRAQLINLLWATPLGLIIMIGTFRGYWGLDEFLPELLGNKDLLFV